MTSPARKLTVAVIGAGLSGLAAAQTISHSNKFTVHLLEASSQPGGRVKNVQLPSNESVPLGATYFHGEKENSVLDLAIRRGIVRREDGHDGKATWTNILSDGTQLPSVVDDYDRVFRGVVSEAGMISQNEQQAEFQESLKEFVTERFNERITGLSSPANCSPQAMLECLLSVEGITYASECLEDMNVSRFGDYKWLEGCQNLLFRGTPLQQVVYLLVRELPRECLHLNCEVESIVWNQQLGNQPHPITVHCTNGDQYSADHVITTVSLGVLKSKSNTPFFTPPLPTDKQEAIACLGYGTVDKVFLQFPEPLFLEEYCSVRVFHRDGMVSDKFPWTRHLHRLHTIPGTNILTAWFVGKDAVKIESLSKSEIADGICHILESALSKPIPSPAVVVTSQWHSNPHFCGSYSYPALGSTKQHRSVLSAPVNGCTPLQLLFAGEATHPTQYGSVHGAYDSGIDTAQALINLYTSRL